MSLNLPESPFYHRDFEYDIHAEHCPTKDKSYYERITLGILPYISLYQPAGKAISLVMGSYRVIIQGSELKKVASNGISYELFAQSLPTVVTISALGATLIGSSFGMVITTVQDIFISSKRAYAVYHDHGVSWETSVAIGRILNNGFYLGLILHGSCGFVIASFTAQVLSGLRHSLDELYEGNLIEAASHLGMSVIRGRQFYSNLQMQKALSEASAEARIIEKGTKIKGVEQFKKTETEIKFAEPYETIPGTRFQKEMKQAKKWDLALEQLEHQHKEKLYDCRKSFSENFQYEKDILGNIKATWVCGGENLNFKICSSSYNSETKVWDLHSDICVDLQTAFDFGRRNINSEEVFLKTMLDPFGSLTVMTVLPGQRIDQWIREGTLQLVTFDMKTFTSCSSDLIHLTRFTTFPKNFIADLKADQYGNVVGVWAGENSLESICYQKEQKLWSPTLRVDSQIAIENVRLVSVPRNGLVAIWKGTQGQLDTLSLGRNVIRSSILNPVEKVWSSPKKIIDENSLKYRRIEDLQIQVDSVGNIIMIWIEAPEPILEGYQFIQFYKQQIEKKGDLNEDDRLFMDFANSIHTFEDYFRKITHYKGAFDIKEFLILNAPDTEASISSVVFDAAKGEWMRPIQFSASTVMSIPPKIVELPSGKIAISWTSVPPSKDYIQEIKQYTEKEIEDRLAGRTSFKDEYEMDDLKQTQREIIRSPQLGIYDPKTKSWTTDPICLDDSCSSLEIGLSPLIDSDKVLLFWKEEPIMDYYTYPRKMKLLAVVYDPVTRTSASQPMLITDNVARDFGVENPWHADYDVETIKREKDKVVFTVRVKKYYYLHYDTASTKTYAVPCAF